MLLTFDRDFGMLTLRPNAPRPAGVLYFRIVPAHPEEPAELLMDLGQHLDRRLEGFLTVLQRGRVRQRPLPRGRNGIARMEWKRR